MDATTSATRLSMTRPEPGAFRRLIDGPAEAEHADFQTYFRTDFARLVALAASITGDTVWAEDLVQEAMATANDRWDHIGSLDKPGAWVRRIVINLALSRRRRAGREGRALLKLAGRSESTFTTEPPSPIFVLVADLPPRQRAVISLHYVDELPVNEIAQIMDLAPATVRTHLDRARQTLRSQLTTTASDSRSQTGQTQTNGTENLR